MLNGPQRKFCEGIAMGLTGTDAYMAAYPKASRASARSGASGLMAKAEVQEEVRRLRGAAETVAGSAVLTLAEKRSFLARLVRAQAALLPEDSDLWQSVKRMKESVEFRLPDKLAALKVDSDLAGGGSEAEMSDSLAQLLGEARK